MLHGLPIHVSVSHPPCGSLPRTMMSLETCSMGISNHLNLSSHTAPCLGLTAPCDLQASHWGGGSLTGTWLPLWPAMVSVPTACCLTLHGNLWHGLMAYCPLPLLGTYSISAAMPLGEPAAFYLYHNNPCPIH